MANSFHIYIPSDNLSVPENATNKFRVILPKTLRFNSTWTCGLASIIYPYSYSAIGTNDKQFIRVLYGYGQDEPTHEVKIHFPSGTYKNEKELEQRLNQIIAKESVRVPYRQPISQTLKRRKRAATNPINNDDEQHEVSDEEIDKTQKEINSDSDQHEIEENEESAKKKTEIVGQSGMTAIDQNLTASATDFHDRQLSDDNARKVVKIETDSKGGKTITYTDGSQTYKFPEGGETGEKPAASPVATTAPPPISDDNSRKIVKVETDSKGGKIFTYSDGSQAYKFPEGGEASSGTPSVTTTGPTPHPVPVTPTPRHQTTPPAKIHISSDQMRQATSNGGRDQQHEEEEEEEEKNVETKTKEDTQKETEEEEIETNKEQGGSEEGEIKSDDDQQKEEEESKKEDDQKELDESSYSQSQQWTPNESFQALRSIKIHYDKILHRFSLTYAHPTLRGVAFSDQLTYALGFQTGEQLYDDSVAKYAPDLSGGISYLYVYTNGLTENMVVGDRLAPLLRIVTVKGKYNDIVETIYDNPIMNRVVPNEVNEIEIEIRGADGRLIPFESGTCMVVLVFKKALYL